MLLTRIGTFSRFGFFQSVPCTTVAKFFWLRCRFSSHCRFLFEESDLLEDFIHGWGNGGQAVNKALNCVMLRHIPTKLMVKCHATRCLERNREIARTRLNEKLDNLLNGENSEAAQERRKHDERERQRYLRAKKHLAAKLAFKARESLDKHKEEEDIVC